MTVTSRRLHFGLGPAAAALALAAWATPAHAQRSEPEVIAEVQGDPVYRVLPPDTIAAIDEPRFVTGEAADAQMSPNEPVLAIDFGGVTRAYSLWQLDAHEIVNDEAGGKKFAVTW